MKSIVKKILKTFGVKLVRESEWNKLKIDSDVYGIDFILNIDPKNIFELLKYYKKSRAQLKQDLFVLSELDFKKGGYFVEFGATDGVNLSNTFLLENDFGWRGILSEPAKCWKSELVKNRNANINFDCVWSETGKTLIFREEEVGEFSSIREFGSENYRHSSVQDGIEYPVQTISLEDLLRKYRAPKVIDFLSIDTEGSEYQILSNFNFNEYIFNVIVCEHNYSPMRQKIFSLLTEMGYTRKYESISKFDDWYVRNDREMESIE